MKGKRRQDTPKIEPVPSPDKAWIAAKMERAQLAAIGHALWGKVLRVEGLEFSERPLERVLEWFNCATVEDLYVALGQGFCTARLVFAAAFEKISKANVVFLLPRQQVDESNTDVDLGFMASDPANTMDTAADFSAAARTFSDRELKEYVEKGEVAAAILRERETAQGVRGELRPDAPAPSDAAQMTTPATATVTARLDDATVKAAAKVGRPRHTLDPRLPEKAPEIFHDRKRRPELGGKKENIVQFVQRVYEPWLDILTRADLRLLDETADKGVANWINAGRKLPQDFLLTEPELTVARRVAELRGAPKLREGQPTPT